MGSLIPHNVSMRGAGPECVCKCARAQSPLTYQANDLQNLYSTARREKRGGMRETKTEERTSVIYEETFTLITGWAGLMCAAPMALVTQW